MALKTNTHNQLNDLLNKEIKELSINKAISKYKVSHPDYTEDFIKTLESELAKQDVIDLSLALKNLGI